MKVSPPKLLRALSMFGCATACAANAPVPQPMSVIFENVRIFDGSSARLSAPSNVLVVGNLIKAISAAPITAPADSRLTRIPGGGRTLMPGLIDNHVHVTLSASSQRDLVDPGVSLETLNARAAPFSS